MEIHLGNCDLLKQAGRFHYGAWSVSQTEKMWGYSIKKNGMRNVSNSPRTDPHFGRADGGDGSASPSCGLDPAPGAQAGENNPLDDALHGGGGRAGGQNRVCGRREAAVLRIAHLPEKEIWYVCLPFPS